MTWVYDVSESMEAKMDARRFFLHQHSDEDLLRQLSLLVAQDNARTADILAHLAEVDARDLYAQKGYSSLFAYATEVLGLSESAAYERIQSARTARRFPIVFGLVAAGKIHLAGVALLTPHLTEENHGELLDAATKKSKREIEELLAARFPKPDARTLLRRVPDKQVAAPMVSADAASLAAPTSVPVPVPEPLPNSRVQPQPMPAAPVISRAETSTRRLPVMPLSEERFRLQVTLSRRGRDLLMRAQALMRHPTCPGAGYRQQRASQRATITSSQERPRCTQSTHCQRRQTRSR
jgi:hypothetical protein